jgi:hypothetical protein
MSDHGGDYRSVKCETCGVPWDEHTDACPRHAHRPECRGHERGGTLECCPRAGQYNGFASGPLIFRCPVGCTCHD